MAKKLDRKLITEDKFKTAIAVLISQDVYPSKLNIFAQLGKVYTGRLSGKQLKWRREVCAGLGFELQGNNLVFDRADGKAPCVECGEFLQDHRRVDCYTMVLYKNCLGEYFKL